jgi:hypothetical protein
VVVVEIVTAAPLTVPAETAQRVAPPPQVGGTVPSEPIPGAALAVGDAFVLHTSKKYGAPLLSVPTARHCTKSPEFVGVEVDDSVTSYALSVNAGGVFKTVSDVVAVCADTRLNCCVPTSNKNATINTITPVRAVRMVIFPAVCIIRGSSCLLYNIINNNK